ncbi:glycoside hydrolase family 17 protein [Acidocella aminolytica]|uniref:Endo-1,3-beta-glucanase btgC n=1 Tax=Acidocella aminolytica 101 = DSM 11237 TaxID=1120923 RepID=A0A0D6PEV5_9PROT|nr:glycoside hydrolase [Acidocella aminolytica]GAN80280.1 glycosyl transferase [Acidocella aminolytica 101 = DSM 11237]GBQ44756.1 exo-beta-1,3-glucanase [Acidocella aminolytica 101 = DSM 11237]SHE93371.1 Exo-beta-1,3-glucanase, GH17 family [Acidocella aminolytica 101 = DSM 11237]
MIKGLSACLLLSLLTVILWWVPNQPQAGDVGMPSGKFNSLSYAPYQAWQSPMDKKFPTPEEISKDLALVKGQANGIRTYSAIEGTLPETLTRIKAGTDVAGLAKKAGLKVWLGIWLSSSPADNAKEMAAGIAEANAYPSTVTRVVVGNEVLLRRDLSVDDLIKDINYVRVRVKQPVAYADVTDFWAQFPQVAPNVDIVMLHFLPYWENKPLSVNGALAEIGATIEKFKKLFPGKQISIGETGWPSRGRWRGPAAPSRVNEAVFLRRFVALADKEGVDYNLIEAFDQNWKAQDEGVAGGNWGIWNASRVQKFPLNGPVVEHPSWPWYAGLAILSGWLLFGVAGFRKARLAVPAFLLANGFAVACIGTLPLLYFSPSHLGMLVSSTTFNLPFNSWMLLDALVNLPLQALLAFIAIRRAGALQGGQKLTATCGGAEMFAELRRLRFSFDYGTLWFLFLVSAVVFEALLVFDGRYRDAPMAVFIVPVIASALRIWTRDWPALNWEEIAAALALVVLALADIVVEGPQNLEFLFWNVAALLLAAPVWLRLARRYKS